MQFFLFSMSGPFTAVRPADLFWGDFSNMLQLSPNVICGSYNWLQVSRGFKYDLKITYKLLLSFRKNGTVQIGSEKTRFLVKLMKLQCSIILFLFTPRKHKVYISISKFDELFEKQHHLSKLLN